MCLVRAPVVLGDEVLDVPSANSSSSAVAPPSTKQPRAKALCTVAVGSGSISFYGATASSTARFEAVRS